MSGRLAIRWFFMTAAALLLIVGLSLGAAPLRAASATYTVTVVGDAATSAVCAASCTLRQAIKASNLNDPGAGQQNTIQFGAGIAGAITLDAAKGALFVSKDVAIVGPSDGVGITVDGNHAVQLFSIGIGATATISNLTLANGSASFGGGIANHGALILIGVSLIGNAAANTGGGIYSDTADALTITNSTFSGNSAHVGGGIALNGSGGVAITNATLSGNTAQFSQGGGLFNLGGTVTLTNTIVAANTDAPNGNTPDDISGAVASGSSHNLIGTGGSGGLVNGTDGNLVGVANPRLGALGSNGNPSGARTLSLLPGSPAIDAGDDPTCAQMAGPAPVGGKDQRGVGRPQGPHCDIGAYETQGAASPLPPPQPTAQPGSPPAPLPPPRPTAPPIQGNLPPPLPAPRP